MTLKEYIKKLQKFAEKHPEALAMPCYAAIDPEGNGYYRVDCAGSFYMAEDTSQEYLDSVIDEGDVEYLKEEGEMEEDQEFKPNIVVIN